MLKSLYFDAYTLFLAHPPDSASWSDVVSIVDQCVAICKYTAGIPSSLAGLVDQLKQDIAEEIDGVQIQSKWLGWTTNPMLPSSTVDTTLDTVQIILPSELSDPVFQASASILKTIPLLGMDSFDSALSIVEESNLDTHRPDLGRYYHSVHTFLEEQVIGVQLKLDAQIST